MLTTQVKGDYSSACVCRIIDRLGQIGYDIEYLSPAFADKFLAHPLVQQPKEITDRSTSYYVRVFVDL